MSEAAAQKKQAFSAWQKMADEDVAQALKTGDVPFYNDWTLRPTNLQYWMAERAARPEWGTSQGPTEYEKDMQGYQRRIEEARKTYKMTHPDESSSWFGLGD